MLLPLLVVKVRIGASGEIDQEGLDLERLGEGGKEGLTD